jgi:hypothetical protein
LTERNNNYLSLVGSGQDNFNLLKTTAIAFNDMAVFWDAITLTPKEESVVAALQILRTRCRTNQFYQQSPDY